MRADDYAKTLTPDGWLDLYSQTLDGMPSDQADIVADVFARLAGPGKGHRLGANAAAEALIRAAWLLASQPLHDHGKR